MMPSFLRERAFCRRGSRFATARAAVFATVASVWLAGSSSADVALTSFRHAERAANAISALEFDEAKSELAQGDRDDPEIAVEEGRLAIYEGRCDDALVALGRPDLLKTEAGAQLFDIARGCARVTAATLVDSDEAHHVVVRYQDEADRALTPLIVETVALARDALTRDLGVTWPRPTRVTVVRDLMSLSAMTGLAQKSAQTTGTVAVAKFGRVTLLSPRASEHGFAWRDTLAHELTHLAVARATADHAPLWLQEGMAKREEVRWRSPGPFDDRPSPDAIAARGFERSLGIPIDALGPSIAMLPSADAAMVAFAEVTSFVRYFASQGGPHALRALLVALRRSPDVDSALRESSGADLRTWDTKWRAYLSREPHEPLPTLLGLDAQPANLRDLRERMRLAELLYSRSHAASALTELDSTKGGVGKDDASVRSLRAHILRTLGRKIESQAEVAEPSAIAGSFGPWWAVRGLWERDEGRSSDAESSFGEAVATDPFDVESACEIDESVTELPDDSDPETAGRALCDAARARHEPAIGRD